MKTTLVDRPSRVKRSVKAITYITPNLELVVNYLEGGREVVDWDNDWEDNKGYP